MTEKIGFNLYLWKDVEELITKAKWNELSLALARMGIEHFVEVVQRMFGKRKVLVALWLGNNEVRLFGDQDLLRQSPFLRYVVDNFEVSFMTADLDNLFHQATRENKEWGIQGGRIEVLHRYLADIHVQILFCVESEDLFFARDIGDLPVVHRKDRPIKEADLLYYLESQVRDVIFTSVVSLGALAKDQSREFLTNSVVTATAGAFHGMERMAVLEYTYRLINDAQDSQSRLSFRELDMIVNLLETLSETKVERSEAEGGILFYDESQSSVRSRYSRQLLFEEQVSLAEYKKVRKYLDISNGQDLFLYFAKDALCGVESTPSFESEGFPKCLSARFRKGGKVIVSFGNTQLFDISNRSYRQALDKYTWMQINEALEWALLQGFLSCQQVLADTEISRRLFWIITSCRARGKGLILIVGKCEKYIQEESIRNIVRIEATSLVNDEIYPFFEALFDHVSAIDGATFIDEHLELIGFSAILPSATGKVTEDPAHGARHNTALRFSKDKRDIFVLVLSEDGPLRFVYDGRFRDPSELKVASDG